MAVFDNAGNEIPDERVAIPTATPGIVKSPYADGDPLPTGAAIRRDGTGTWVYYPTEQALRMGKIIAAFDTLSQLPEQVTQTLGSVGVDVRDKLPWIIGGVAVVWLLTRR